MNSRHPAPKAGALPDCAIPRTTPPDRGLQHTVAAHRQARSEGAHGTDHARPRQCKLACMQTGPSRHAPHLSRRAPHLSCRAPHLSCCAPHLPCGAPHLSCGVPHLSCCAHHLSCCAQSQHPEIAAERFNPGFSGFRLQGFRGLIKAAGLSPAGYPPRGRLLASLFARASLRGPQTGSWITPSRWPRP